MEKNIIDYFINLVRIDSESRNEKAVADKLQQDLLELGAEIKFDQAHQKTGGDIGNLYAYFKGRINKPPLLFCAHMDTVQPGIGIKPQIRDGNIYSDGTTVLGSDDKSGIAEIMFGIKAILESKEDFAPLEVVFTISEEIGLLGAKGLDYNLISSTIGFALDGHEVGTIAIAAPAQNSISYTIHGKEAHAGVEPEKGLNAIKIASEAISIMPLGRIDEETTCNIGLIQGGKATNIIPNRVEIKAEARSHDPVKLKDITDRMNKAVQETVNKYQINGCKARVDIKVNQEYTAFRLKDDDLAVLLAEKAAAGLNMNFCKYIGGGGSDVNIFNQNGLQMAVAGTGMRQVHTVHEQIKISDLQAGAEWVKEVIRIYSEN